MNISTLAANVSGVAANILAFARNLPGLAANFSAPAGIYKKLPQSHLCRHTPISASQLKINSQILIMNHRPHFTAIDPANGQSATNSA